MKDRIKKAFNTNDAQFSSVVMLTLLMIIAAGSANTTSIFVWLFAIGFWPMFAFISNLIDPIPGGSND